MEMQQGIDLSELKNQTGGERLVQSGSDAGTIHFHAVDHVVTMRWLFCFHMPNRQLDDCRTSIPMRTLKMLKRTMCYKLGG
jgi:hypothetical protein